VFLSAPLSGDRALSRFITFRFSIYLLAIGLTRVSPAASWAQRSGEGGDYEDRGGAVYQRRGNDWNGRHGGKHGRRFDRGRHWVAPQVNSGWFQRPYPYHLDYYKMRYGGSYAPYFGNLYVPPQVVTAPPYFGPYYNGFEFANPGDGAFNGQNPFQGGLNGAAFGAPVEQAAPANSDELPPP
jgi:hypothetical protein